ncbi:hypothetical protein D3C72_2452320 [compost metagenome]
MANDIPVRKHRSNNFYGAWKLYLYFSSTYESIGGCLFNGHLYYFLIIEFTGKNLINLLYFDSSPPLLVFGYNYFCVA